MHHSCLSAEQKKTFSVVGVFSVRWRCAICLFFMITPWIAFHCRLAVHFSMGCLYMVQQHPLRDELGSKLPDNPDGLSQSEQPGGWPSPTLHSLLSSPLALHLPAVGYTDRGWGPLHPAQCQQPQQQLWVENLSRWTSTTLLYQLPAAMSQEPQRQRHLPHAESKGAFTSGTH